MAGRRERNPLLLSALTCCGEQQHFCLQESPRPSLGRAHRDLVVSSSKPLESIEFWPPAGRAALHEEQYPAMSFSPTRPSAIPSESPVGEKEVSRGREIEPVRLS